jgi:hypothetical protein
MLGLYADPKSEPGPLGQVIPRRIPSDFLGCEGSLPMAFRKLNASKRPLTCLRLTLQKVGCAPFSR